MVVRFDNKAVQQTVDRKCEPIGVDGDGPSHKGSISEADAIVLKQKEKLEDNGELMERMPSGIVEEDEQEAGPELNPQAVEAARKDKMPEPPSEAKV